MCQCSNIQINMLHKFLLKILTKKMNLSLHISNIIIKSEYR